MEVTLRQLRYFMAVAEELSFTRAARRLHLSQPALSVQIRHLEREVGAELLARTSRSVELTDAGRGLYEDLQRLFADLDRARERSRRTHEGARAALRIAYTPSVAYEALPLLLEELAAAAPEVAVAAHQAVQASALDALRAGQVDLALVREFAGAEGLSAEPVRREPLVAVMSDRHPLAIRDRLRLEDLRGRVVVVVPASLSPGFHELVARLCAPRTCRATTTTSSWGRRPWPAWPGPASSGCRWRTRTPESGSAWSGPAARRRPRWRRRVRRRARWASARGGSTPDPGYSGRCAMTRWFDALPASIMAR